MSLTIVEIPKHYQKVEVPEHYQEWMTKLLNNKIFPVKSIRVEEEVGTTRTFIDILYNFDLINNKNIFRQTIYVSSLMLKDIVIDTASILIKNMLEDFNDCARAGIDGFLLEDADILNAQWEKCW
jgi:hypothetical protein